MNLKLVLSNKFDYNTGRSHEVILYTDETETLIDFQVC